MPISLRSNLTSDVLQRQLSRSTSALSKNFERLSSGMRINRASDDAAGLAISSRLQSDSRVYTQALRNANDGISALSIAQGALEQGTDILGRLRELATSAANGPLSRTQRVSLDKEAFSLVDEFNRLSSESKFGNLKIIDGSLGSLGIQLGFGSNGQITFSIGNYASRNVAIGYNSGVNTAGFTNPTGNYATGDINNDGKEDLVIIESGTSGVKVLTGNSTGSMSSQSSVDGLVIFNDVKLADLNGDNKLDIVAATTTGIRTYLGNGNGTFTNSSTFNTGISYGLVEVGDYNSDGKTDITALRAAAGTLETFLASTTSSWSLYATNTVQTGATKLIKVDFNGDGISDFAVGSSTTLTILQGSASNILTNVQTVSTNAAQLATGDFNHDGLSDLVINNTGSLQLLTGKSDGTVNSATTLGSVGLATAIAVVDLNGDGLEDIGYTSSGTTFSSLLSNGSGTFTSGLSKTLSGGFIGAVDADGDGVKDLLDDDDGGSGFLKLWRASTTQTTNLLHINITTRAGALSALDTIEAAFNKLELELGNIGSSQSRLESSIGAILGTRDNYISADSRIRDADIADESAQLIKNQILQQAAASLLGQANQAPALALSLLQG